MDRILVTGAAGQIGSDLVPALREIHGQERVIASDLDEDVSMEEPLVSLDVCDVTQLEKVIHEHDIDTVFHLAALLSASGEQNPSRTFDVNVGGLRNVFAAVREGPIEKVIVPSSIAVFGGATPKNPNQRTILDPSTMYGVTKVTTELLGNYYVDRCDLDVRGLRFPGLISHGEEPGGGTTDYAVEAIVHAVAGERYTYFVRPDTKLPMMYMPDAIKALLRVATAPKTALTHPCSYNVTGYSFTAAELTSAIQSHIPSFEPAYAPDYRQSIADTWPEVIDDSAAKADWGWEASYDLAETVSDMIEHLSADHPIRSH